MPASAPLPTLPMLGTAPVPTPPRSGWLPPLPFAPEPPPLVWEPVPPVPALQPIKAKHKLAPTKCDNALAFMFSRLAEPSELASVPMTIQVIFLTCRASLIPINSAESYYGSGSTNHGGSRDELAYGISSRRKPKS